MVTTAEFKHKIILVTPTFPYYRAPQKTSKDETDFQLRFPLQFVNVLLCNIVN